MIGLGCDHGGLELKKTVMEYLDSKGIEYKDFGTYTSDSCDYPVYGKAVAHAVADGQCDKGIIICGTGIGISITANKVKGIRAALCHDVFQQRQLESITMPIFLLWVQELLDLVLLLKLLRHFRN